VTASARQAKTAVLRAAGMPEVYVPVLKGRQGEFAAISSVRPSTRESILPLIEIVPGPAEEDVALRSVIDRTAKKLSPWASRRLLLDAGLLPTDAEVDGDRGPVWYSVFAAQEELVVATPVIRLNDEPRAHRDAALLNERYRNGVALRLSAEDLDEDSDDIDEALSGLLEELGLSRHHVDLVLDLGVVNGDLAVRAGSRIAADALRGLSGIDEWRQIVVAAGAFPSDLSNYGAWTIGEPIRYDAALYDHLQQRKRLPRMPIFGDYGIAHPLLATGPAFPPAPQLRYTVADRWLTLKGARNDPRGHEQFYEVCETIAQHPEFAGAALGRADARIADSRRYGPGNASTWREIGTTHHMDFVVQRLTSLGEP
jgi:hypothetical protein